MSSSINSSANSILRYSSIINQVYLLKSIFPLSFSITQFINFLFGLIVIAIFLFANGVTPRFALAYLPVLLVLTLVFLSAIGLVSPYCTVFIRDLCTL